MNNRFEKSLFLLFSVSSMIVCMDEIRVQEEASQKPESSDQLALKSTFSCSDCLMKSFLFCCYGCYDEKDREIELYLDIDRAIEAAAKQRMRENGEYKE